MAKTPKQEEPKPKKAPKEKKEKGVLEAAAEAIGSTIGKAAVATGIVHPTPPSTPPRPKVPKLAKKNKTRTPRKEKKRLRKAQSKNAA